MVNRYENQREIQEAIESGIRSGTQERKTVAHSKSTSCAVVITRRNINIVYVKHQAVRLC